MCLGKEGKVLWRFSDCTKSIIVNGVTTVSALTGRPKRVILNTSLFRDLAA